MLFGAPRLRGFAFAGDHHVGDTEVTQLLVDLGFAVAAVGGDRARRTPGAFLDPRHRGGQLRGIGRIARFHSVIQNNTVIVVHHLGLVPEFDRFAEASLGDRASIAVVQADPPRRPVGGDPGDALAGLRHDPVSHPAARSAR